MSQKTKQRSKALFALPLDLAPMEARSVGEIPKSKGWQYERKWMASAAWHSGTAAPSNFAPNPESRSRVSFPRSSPIYVQHPRRASSSTANS